VSGFDTVIVRFYFTGYQQKVGMYSWETLSETENIDDVGNRLAIFLNHEDHKVFTQRARRNLCGLCGFLLSGLCGSICVYKSSAGNDWHNRPGCYGG